MITEFQKEFCKIETVYEDFFFVRREDLEKVRKTLVHIFDRKGNPVCEKVRGNDGKFYSQGKLLHKGNIRNIF